MEFDFSNFEKKWKDGCMFSKICGENTGSVLENVEFQRL